MVMDSRHLRELMMRKVREENIMSRYSSGGGGGAGGRRGVEDMMPRGLVKSRSDSKLADHSIPPPKALMGRRASVHPACPTVTEDSIHEGLLQKQLQQLRLRRGSNVDDNNNCDSTATSPKSRLTSDSSGGDALTVERKPLFFIGEEEACDDVIDELEITSKVQQDENKTLNVDVSTTNVTKIKQLLDRINVKCGKVNGYVKHQNGKKIHPQELKNSLNGELILSESQARSQDLKYTSMKHFMTWLKREMVLLRVSDQCIAGRLLTLYNDITCRRLSRHLSHYQTILDEADDIQQSRDIMLTSNWCDLIPESFDSQLIKIGVTRHNIIERRYSV